jgi:hypothetical protein
MTLLLLPASLKLTFLRSSRKIKAFAAPALGAHGAPAGPMLWPSSVSNDAPSEIMSEIASETPRLRLQTAASLPVFIV